MRASTIPRFVIALPMLLAACANTSGGGPQETLRRYVEAVVEDRPAEAYALLDESVRKQMTPSEFTARWKGLRDELLVQAGQLKTAVEKPISARAQVTLRSGGHASLSLTNDIWRIEDGVAFSGGAATPADALRAFVRAVEARNYEAVTRLLARSVRENIERDITERTAKLKQALNQEIEVTGGRARLQYDAKFKVELIQEDGEWRIQDLD
jgi:hypothetical protein